MSKRNETRQIYGRITDITSNSMSVKIGKDTVNINKNSIIMSTGVLMAGDQVYLHYSSRYNGWIINRL